MVAVRRYSPVVGLLLLALLATQIDTEKAWRAMRQLDALSIAGAAAAFTANLAIKAVRWQRMLGLQGIKLPWSQTLAAFLSGNFYGMVTIGKLGELLRVEVALGRAASSGSALATCVADRLMDVACLMLVFALSTLGTIQHVRSEFFLWAIAGITVLALLLLFARLAGASRAERLRTSLGAWLERRPLVRRVAGAGRDFTKATWELLVGRGALGSATLTLISWGGYFACVLFLARGLSIEVPAFAIVGATSTAAATSVLPFTFQGLGTREAAYALMLAPYGTSMTEAVTLSLSSLALFYAVALPLGAVGLFWRHRQTSDGGKTVDRPQSIERGPK